VIVVTVPHHVPVGLRGCGTCAATLVVLLLLVVLPLLVVVVLVAVVMLNATLAMQVELKLWYYYGAEVCHQQPPWPTTLATSLALWAISFNLQLAMAWHAPGGVLAVVTSCQLSSSCYVVLGATWVPLSADLHDVRVGTCRAECDAVARLPL